MTREGGAIGFVVRLLLGGALISGGLLYAAQALQKAPASREPVAEKIGPALSTRQATQAAKAPAPPPEPTVPAPPPGTPPAAEPAPQARVTTTFGTDPAPVAPAVQSQNAAAADPYGVMADDTPAEAPAAAEGRAARAAAKGPRGAQGCTQYKSYNPQTQTYRGFDGKIKDCKP